jgi:hypothetical protein
VSVERRAWSVEGVLEGAWVAGFVVYVLCTLYTLWGLMIAPLLCGSLLVLLTATTCVVFARRGLRYLDLALLQVIQLALGYLLFLPHGPQWLPLPQAAHMAHFVVALLVPLLIGYLSRKRLRPVDPSLDAQR